MLFYILLILANGYLFSNFPQPLSPPDGYVSYGDVVELHVSRDEAVGPIAVELMQKDGASMKLFAKYLLTKNFVRVSNLKPDNEYCWRVLGAVNSRYFCFETSVEFIKF